MVMIDINTTVPSEFYNSRLSDRYPYELRAQKISEISLPYVMRAKSAGESADLDKANAQSFNGRQINNLKAKMGMALLPPATSSFRLKPDATALAQLFQGNEGAIEKIRQQLSLNTDAINAELENQQIRSSLFDMLLQQIVVGSVIVEKNPRKGITIFPLRSFVVDLDSQGEPLAMCIVEKLKHLPENITPKEEKDEYELYTLLAFDKDTDSWIMKQDIEGEPVGEEETFSDYDELPFRYFGWNWLQGDKYHRPFAEDYYADMLQVDKLAKLNTEGAIVAAKTLVLVNQRGGRTRKKDVVESSNGAVVDGSAEDITAFQLQKNYDFQVSNEREAVIKRELQANFLDTGSVQRDAERVTAEEIRVMAQQLEASTLAGVYSKMALKWSKWIVTKVMDELKIKFEAIDVSVLTGLDALGRSQEAQKQDNFMQRVTQLQLNHWIKESELLQRYAAFDGINTVNLLKTSEEVKAEQKQQSEQQAKQQLVESGAQSLGQEAGKAITNQ